MTAVETPSQPLDEAVRHNNYIVTRTKRFNRGTAHVSLRFVITVRYVFLIALRTQIISSRQRNLCSARVHHCRCSKWYSASENDLIFVLLFIFLSLESVSSRKSYLLKWKHPPYRNACPSEGRKRMHASKPCSTNIPKCILRYNLNVVIINTCVDGQLTKYNILYVIHVARALHASHAVHSNVVRFSHRFSPFMF